MTTEWERLANTSKVCWVNDSAFLEIDVEVYNREVKFEHINQSLNFRTLFNIPKIKPAVWAQYSSMFWTLKVKSLCNKLHNI